MSHTFRHLIAIGGTAALVQACGQASSQERVHLPEIAVAALPATPAAASAPPGTAAITATARGFADALRLTGTTEPHRRSTLTPKVSGTILRVYVREGDLVREGMPLVALDTADFALRLRQAEAALDGARVQEAAYRREWNRLKGLAAEKAVATNQVDQFESQTRGAEAGVKQAEVMVDMAKKAMHDAIVRAPFDGVITRRMVSEGEYAMQMPPTHLVVIEETNTLDLRVQVPEMMASRVGERQNLAVTFHATRDEMRGSVRRVVPSVDPRTRSFSVIVELPNPDLKLRPGMFATVAFDPLDAPGLRIEENQP